MRSVILGTVTGLALLASNTSAPIARQVRDAGAGASQGRAAAGSAVVAGIVISQGPSRQPVRHATVRLDGDQLGGARLVGTDDEGKFEFAALPAGTFTLSASKPAYVETFHGARRAGRGPGVPVAVGSGERVNVTIGLVRGGVITGFVRDAFGNAAVSVAVRATGLQAGAAAAVGAGRALTDDRGEYRIFGLAPGEYHVSALPQVAPGPLPVIGEILTVSDKESQWAMAIASGVGRFTGNASATVPPPPPGRPAAYAPVFFPDTSDPAQATPIEIAAGDERSGINIALQIVPVAKLEGRLVLPDGGPVKSATVSLFPRRSTAPSLAARLVAAGILVLPRATVNPPTFSIPGVPPGDYTLVAQSGSSQERPTSAEASADRLWSVSDVTVAGNDQTNMILRLAPGLRLSGRIVVEGASSDRPSDPSAIGLTLSAVGTSLGFASKSKAVISPQGDVLFHNVAPGAYLLQATLSAAATAAGWILESATLEGKDIADVPLSVESGVPRLGELKVVIANRAASIDGRVLDAASQPAAGYAVVAAATNRDFWLAGSRRVRSVSLATDGSFRFAGLPAGEYGVALVLDVEDGDLADTAFLSQVVASGYTISLGPGESRRQDLRISGG